ncbi:MAG: type II toxin-antitoxin system VapC family toxin [Micrococcales bacterium]|nr:type II toxin-antitoxin system VapC family toxin [Micrococcales bacterium]
MDSDDLLLDTSAALALIDPASTHHGAVLAACAARALGLCGHAAFEFLSVTTRLPFPSRISGADAVRLMAADFPATRQLDADAAAGLPAEFARLGVTGGAVYDGLVGACARRHGLTLVTCDRRAQPTYEALGVTYKVV